MKKKIALWGFITIILVPMMSSMIVESLAQEPQKIVQPPIGNRLTITVPDNVVDRDKWVFMFGGTYDNQYWIIDSIYLHRYQTTFTFENVKQRSNIQQIEIIFEGGYANAIMFCRFDDTFDIHYSVDSLAGKSITGTGGRSNYFQIKGFHNRRINYLHKQDTLAKLRKEKVPFERLQQIEDSLDKVHNDYFEQCTLEGLYSPYEEIIIVNWRILRDSFQYNKERLDSLWTMLSERFPNNVSILWSQRKFQFPPQNKETQRTLAKRNELIAGESIERPKVEPYKMGDVASGLAIMDKDGKMVSLDSIKTKFVLVDFWAHWCVPCRKETPYLLQAQNEFPDQFTVLAVSVDKNAQKWLNAMRDDHSEALTHVLLGEGTEESNLVLAKFGVNSVPANYLLDDQRKIIAIDLRGEQLLDVIREFCK